MMRIKEKAQTKAKAKPKGKAKSKAKVKPKSKTKAKAKPKKATKSPKVKPTSLADTFVEPFTSPIAKALTKSIEIPMDDLVRESHPVKNKYTKPVTREPKKKPMIVTFNGSNEEYEEWRGDFDPAIEMYNQEAQDDRKIFEYAIEGLQHVTRTGIPLIIPSEEMTADEISKIIQDSLDIFGGGPTTKDDLQEWSRHEDEKLKDEVVGQVDWFGEYKDSQAFLKEKKKEINKFKQQLKFVIEMTPEEMKVARQVGQQPTPNNNKITFKRTFRQPKVHQRS